MTIDYRKRQIDYCKGKLLFALNKLVLKGNFPPQMN